MLNPVDQLATSIRLKDCRGVQRALSEGACPNAYVPLARDERFGANQAPVLFLAIHYDLPPAIELLAHSGADLHRAVDAGLTPRAHAAWRFRWQCLDAFDGLQIPLHDDPMVLATIATHWTEPYAHPELEEVFFSRLARASICFSMTPDLGMTLLASILCGPMGYRVSATQRLLDDYYFKGLGERLKEAMLTQPDRFVPALAKLYSAAYRFAGGTPLPEATIELLAEHGIPLCPPSHASINDEARKWLDIQQCRIDSCLQRKDLEATTGTVEGSRGKRRL